MFALTGVRNNRSKSIENIVGTDFVQIFVHIIQKFVLTVFILTRFYYYIQIYKLFFIDYKSKNQIQSFRKGFLGCERKVRKLLIHSLSVVTLLFICRKECQQADLQQYVSQGKQAII